MSEQFKFGDLVHTKIDGEPAIFLERRDDLLSIIICEGCDISVLVDTEDIELIARPEIQPVDFVGRMENELSGLAGKLEKLKAFFTTDTFKSLPPEKCELMLEQCSAMGVYKDILERRIKLEKNK